MPACVPLTPVAAERVARESAEHAFGRAARALGLDWHMTLDAKQVERWSERLGDAVVSRRQAEAESFERGVRPPVPANIPQLLVIGMDGGRVQERQKDPQTQSRWREDKVASVTTYVPGDGGEKEAQPLVTTYVATMKDAAGFGPLVAVEAYRRGSAAAHTVLNLSDGGEWIDTQGELWRLADARIIDHKHASGHLHDVAEAVCGKQTPEARALWEELGTHLWEGRIEAVIARIEREAGRLGPVEKADPPGHPRRVLRQNAGYFTRHKEHMRYDQFRRKGWPIGSGVTEAGVKGFNKRVKGTDQFWNRSGVESILALRALWMSQDGRWERYWENRSAYGHAIAA